MLRASFQFPSVPAISKNWKMATNRDEVELGSANAGQRRGKNTARQSRNQQMMATKNTKIHEKAQKSAIPFRGFLCFLWR